MQDQEQEENKMDVITVDVPLFIRLLEFAREDATDDMMLHDVAEKLIEMCADGDIMQMEQYDEIVGSKEQVDTSGMNAVEDNMHPQNKDMDTINEQRWMKLAGIITEEEDYGDVNDPDNYPAQNQPTNYQKEFGLNIGDLVIVRDSNKEPERGEIIAFDELVVVKLDNGQTVEVSPYAVEKMSDFFNENESAVPTITKAELTDIPAMKGIGQTIKLTLSNGKVQHISPGNLEGMYGGDADDLNSFVGEKWED
jgi:hypothetical protein